MYWAMAQVIDNFISNLLNRNNAMQNMNNTLQKNDRTIPYGLFRSSIKSLQARLHIALAGIIEFRYTSIWHSACSFVIIAVSPLLKA